MSRTYVAPGPGMKAFTCPHCGAFAQQTWDDVGTFSSGPVSRGKGFRTLEDIFRSKLQIGLCISCKKWTLWLGKRPLYPDVAAAVPANPDMPDAVRSDYEEAARIAMVSPRGAAALLRLSIQKLCKELGEKGDIINNDIGSLVKKGLKPTIQKALDVVRVVGNNAVHPGQMDLKDDNQTVQSLFSLVNLVVEEMISEPKRIEEMFSLLPEEVREHIGRRDGQPSK